MGRGPAAWLTALLVLSLLSGIGISAEHHHDALVDAIPCAVCHMGQAAEVPAPPVVAAVSTAPLAEEPAPARALPPATPSLRTPPVRGPPLVV